MAKGILRGLGRRTSTALGQSLLRNSLFLLTFATSSLFAGSAFVYMATKSPFFWGGAFLPGVVLLLVFVVTAILAVVSMLWKPTKASS
jgi:hypothetical protein